MTSPTCPSRRDRPRNRRVGRAGPRCSPRERRTTRHRIVDDDSATSTRRNPRIGEGHRTIRRTTIRARVAVIDAACTAADDHDTDHRSNRLTNPTKATASRAPTDFASTSVGRRGRTANRSRTRRHRHVRRRVDRRGRRLCRLLRFSDRHLGVGRRVRSLRDLLFARCGRFRDWPPNVSTPNRVKR